MLFAYSIQTHYNALIHLQAVKKGAWFVHPVIIISLWINQFEKVTSKTSVFPSFSFKDSKVFKKKEMKNSTWQSFFCSHLKPIGGRLYARGRKISPLGIRVNVFPFQWSERSNSQIQNGKSSGFIGAALHTKVLTQSDLNIILFTSNPVQLYYQYIDTVQMCTVEQAYIYIYFYYYCCCFYATIMMTKRMVTF